MSTALNETRPSGSGLTDSLTLAVRPVVRAARAMYAAGISRWLRHCRSERIAAPMGSAIVLAPHQDDETLGCGGVIALKRLAGVSVQVAILTDGASQWPDFGELSRAVVNGRCLAGNCQAIGSDQRSASGGGSYSRRDLEALAATGILGVPSSAVHFFGCPDSKLGKLAEKRRREVIERLAQLIRDHRASEIYVPHRSDVHADHEAAFRLVLEAVNIAQIPMDLLEYPIWLHWLSARGRSGFDHAIHVPIQRVLPIKRRAIGVYQSQISSLPAGFIFRFLQPVEIFFRSTYS